MNEATKRESGVITTTTRVIATLSESMNPCISGSLAAINGRLTVGNLTSFLTYANQYTKPFNEISGVVTELQHPVGPTIAILWPVLAERFRCSIRRTDGL